MSQILAMPLNNSTVTVCYKRYAPNYYKLGAGPVHYGVDFTGTSNTTRPREFFASGNGVVLGINLNANQTVGRWVIVKYPDVEGFGDVVVRYFHLNSIYVDVGDQVTLNTKIGQYGSTGRYSTGPHLHVEVDTDTVYWNYTPTISSSRYAGALRAGIRDATNSRGELTGAKETTTRNPLEVFRVKKSEPENQSLFIEFDEDYRILGPNVQIFY